MKAIPIIILACILQAGCSSRPQVETASLEDLGRVWDQCMVADKHGAQWNLTYTGSDSNHDYFVVHVPPDAGRKFRIERYEHLQVKRFPLSEDSRQWKRCGFGLVPVKRESPPGVAINADALGIAERK
jgi:hypothetical protein